MAAAVQRQEPVSRRMVRHVVAQGQWNNTNSMVQRAVCQVQPCCTSTAPISATPASARPPPWSIIKISGSSSSVTIKGLKIGTYTVTEVTGWSWRDKPNKGEQSVTLKATGKNSVTFTNTRSNTEWLDGNAYRKNEFMHK